MGATPLLFTPVQLGRLELRNRIVVSPMCQYAATEGNATAWHLQHLGAFAISGAGLVILEATAVEPTGRITNGCLGLYSDANEEALYRTLAAVREVALPGTRFGIQLSHAGWKASIRRPWEGGLPLTAEEGPWETFGASARSFAPGWPAPSELDEAGLERVERAFADAARRAVRLGFDLIELHMAHGYLLHSFASPISNHRADAYGGTQQGRHAFPLRVAQMVAQSVPQNVVVGARITGSDWLDGGIDVADAAVLAAGLKRAGVSYVCVSSGGIVPDATIEVKPLYQVPFAAHVKRNASITTIAVGMIRTPREAEKVIAEGDADLVAMGRNFHFDPRWPWLAARELGFELQRPPQYMRKRAA